MSPIAKALDEIKFRIPEAILKEAFKQDNYSWRSVPISTDEIITNKVIRSRVLVDCNLVGGIETLINLVGLSPTTIDEITLVYHIPKDRTQNRTIVNALSVGYLNYTNAFNVAGVGSVTAQAGNDVLNAALAVMQSHSGAPLISTARVSLIGNNTIMVRDANRVITNNYLRCRLSDDEDMNGLQARSIPAFCKLVELAVKSYIYNTLIIKMGSAYLSGGQELGIFKSIVEGFADSEQMYQDYLVTIWRKVAMMNDTESYTRFLKLQIGSMK